MQEKHENTYLNVCSKCMRYGHKTSHNFDALYNSRLMSMVTLVLTGSVTLLFDAKQVKVDPK